MGLIERSGHGTQVIVEDCQRADCPDPTYSLKGGCFVVTYPVGAESGEESGQSRARFCKFWQQGPLSKAEIAALLVGRG